MKIKRGSVTVCVSRCTVKVRGVPYRYHRLRFTQDGKLQRPLYKTEDEARAAAELKAIELANQRTASGGLSAADAASFARARQILASHNLTKPLELAIAEYCEAMTCLIPDPAHLTPSLTLRTSVEFYARHHPGGGQKSYSDIVAAFLEYKQADGTRWRYRCELTDRLTYLKPSFPCALASLTAGDITAKLDELQKSEHWTNRTRNHYRAALFNLAAFARAGQLIPRDWEEMNHVQRFKEKQTVRRADPPVKIATILRAAPPKLLPALVLCYFCEVRVAEVVGRPDDDVPPLDWRDIYLESGELRILEGKIREAHGREATRIVHVPENAVVWLRPYQKKSGPVWRGSPDQFQKQRLALCRRLNLKWEHNAGRRTAISLRDSETKSQLCRDRTLESGTDEATRQRHYIDPKLRQEVGEYRAILPARGLRRKIIPFRSQKTAKNPKEEDSQKANKSD